MLSELVFRGFRNLTDASWRPEEGSHLLVGPNGAGKTSLLEAVYFLATSKSFRASRAADCCRHGASGFSLFGRLGGDERCELELEWGAQGLSRRLNGNPVALADYLAALPVVVWTTSEARLIDGLPGLRRRFLDQGVVGSKPAAIGLLARYRRALEQKRLLLKSDGRGLGAWNEVLATAAVDLITERSAYVAALERTFAGLVEESGLELPSLELRYLPSPAAALEGGEAALAAFVELRGREREAAQPLAGPHRDELKLLWGGREARRVSSAGERKLFGMLLTAARSRVLAAGGRAPIVLLDDVDAELDDARLRHLWRLFPPRPQVFASSTDESLVRRLAKVTEWRLERGSVRAGKEP